MTARILDVGNCSMDHAALTRWLTRDFDVETEQAHGISEAIEMLRQRRFDLVTVNRLMDQDGAEGLGLIRQMKTDRDLRSIPVMLVSNFPEHQEMAVAAGAEQGFGKRDFRNAPPPAHLRALLPARIRPADSVSG